MSEKKETQNSEKKIPHHRSSDFSSHYVTGSIVTGPTADGLFQLHFHIDTISIEAETAIPVEGADNTYTLTTNTDDMLQFRENKTRISLNRLGLEGLYSAIGKHLEKYKDEAS